MQKLGGDSEKKNKLVKAKKEPQKKEEYDPFKEFVRNHPKAKPEDLTKYLDVTNQTKAASSTSLAAIMIALTLALLAGYKNFIESVLNILPVYFVYLETALITTVIGIAIGLIVFLLRQILPGKVKENFDRYLEAKWQLEQKTKETGALPENHDVDRPIS